jgi:mono/diheme cytochrome c family protein
VLLAITSEGKLGLGILAGAFIVFALLSAFYFPRRNPDFPGKRLGLYITVAALFFVGSMAGVIFFAAEEEEAHGAEATETNGTETGEAPLTTTEAAGAPTGDPAAGEAVFASAGCGGCHTLEAAGATGTVGPNLDEAKPEQALVIDRVTHGKSVMPSFAGQLSEKQIQDVAAYVVDSTQG